MNELPIAEYGALGLMIGALVLIIRAFLKHLKCKDQIFTETIQNHIHEDVEIKEKLISSHDKLSEVINRLINKLDK